MHIYKMPYEKAYIPFGVSVFESVRCTQMNGRLTLYKCKQTAMISLIRVDIVPTKVTRQSKSQFIMSLFSYLPEVSVLKRIVCELPCV